MFEHLLVPLDGHELSERAMDQSIALALKLGAAITGFVAELHTGPPAAERALADQRAAAHAHRVLQHFAHKAQAAGVCFQPHHARTSSVADAIVQAAQDGHCDLIVMVTHGRGAFGEMLFGSNSKNVVGLSKVAVLVLH